MTNIPVNKQEVARCLPHEGPMVLLERVLQCTEESLECETSTHLQPEHPLSIEGQLSVFAGVEYAAQAMALHKCLNAESDGKVRSGFVAVTSNLMPHLVVLNQASGTLNVAVNMLDSSGGGSLYEFHISHGQKKLPVLDGRLLVMLSDE